MYVGAYIVLLAGLFWVMSFTTIDEQQFVRPFDWVWGLGIAIVLLIGTVCASKGYILGIIGFSIEFIGLALCVWLFVFGVSKQHFVSVPLIIGFSINLLGFIISLVYHILGMIKIAKHGNSLL